MATVASLGATFDTNSGTHTVTATPTFGDLIVIIVANTGSAESVAPTDNNAGGGGTYTLITTALKNTSADTMRIYVRNSLVTSATSTVFTQAPGATTGGGLFVLRAAGMSKVGANAVKQSAVQQNQAAAGTPAPVLGGVPQSGNPVISSVFNATSPGGVTQRTGYTEPSNLGYSTPTTGLDDSFLNSGEASATITWGSTSASAFSSLAVELDTTANPVDEDAGNAGGFWSGINQFATRAVATALLAASFTASVAQTVANQPQEEIVAQGYIASSGNPPIVIFQGRTNVVGIGYDEIPAASLRGQLDEDLWQNPTPSLPATLQYPQQWAFDESEIPQAVTFVPDDSGWWHTLTPTIPFQPMGGAQPAVIAEADEDFWVNPTPPVAASLIYPQQWTFDEQTPTLTATVDEDFWVNPTPPVAGSLGALYLPDPEELPAADLTATVDEYFWVNPTPPVAGSLGPLYLPDPEELPAAQLSATVDEYFWINPNASCYQLNQYPQQWVFDEQTPVLHGQYDEDFWNNPAVTCYQSNLWPQQASFDEQPPTLVAPTAALDDSGWFHQLTPTIPFYPYGGFVPVPPFHPEEDFWQNPTAPVAASLLWPQQWTFDEQTPALVAVTFTPDEDFYTPPFTLSDHNTVWEISVWLDDGATVPSFQPDEDFWQNPLPTSCYQSNTYIQQWALDPVEIVPLVVTLQPDEDFWQNPTAPVVASLIWPQQASFDEQFPFLHGQYDEDFWTPQIPSVIWLPPTQAKLADDEDVYIPQVVDEVYWQNPTRPVVATNYQPLPYLPDISDVIATLRPLDEDFWINAVAPVPLVELLLQPFIFEQYDFANTLAVLSVRIKAFGTTPAINAAVTAATTVGILGVSATPNVNAAVTTSSTTSNQGVNVSSTVVFGLTSEKLQ